MNAWTVLFVIYAAVFISSPLIAVFHELGHAFAYLILTKPDKVDIFIGSYGNTKNAIDFRTGKIHFYIKKSFPFVKGIGLCRSDKSEDNYLRYIIILVAGAVFTLLTAAIIAFIAFATNAHLLVQIFCYIFLGFSAMSLISNLVPRQLTTTNGIGLNSDGNQLVYTLKLKSSLGDYNKAVRYYINGDYEDAVTCFQKVLVAKPNDLKVLRLLVGLSGTIKRYDDVAYYLSRIEAQGELAANDMISRAMLQSALHQNDEAILTYQAILKKDKLNLIALNNVAEELIDKGAYIVAQRALDKIIKFYPKYPYGYRTMAYSKIMQGEYNSAKQLLDKSFELAPENAYNYKILGVFYLKIKDTDKAASNFAKAVELDKTIDMNNFTEELKQLTEKQITT